MAGKFRSETEIGISMKLKIAKTGKNLDGAKYPAAKSARAAAKKKNKPLGQEVLVEQMH